MSHQAASMVWFSNEGAAALFGCECDVQSLIHDLAGLLEKPHAYSAAGITEDAHVWVVAISKTWTPRLPGTNDWDIRFSAMVQVAAGFETETRLVVDGAYYHELSWEDDGRWLGSHGEVILPLDQSPHTIAVEMRSSTIAMEASIKEISLVAMVLAE
jgi:hypothetical protein